MFSWFERLVAPFADDDRSPPRDGLLRFVVFYAKPVWPVLVAMAVLTAAISVIEALSGNFPMRFRWQVHRWLLGQSLTFFQDEFAGRIATKLMQTALAVRETVMKFLDVMLYVAVYFTGIVVLVAGADWRLALPFVAWLAGYAALLRYFIPRLGRVAERQANARAEMTGRVVDAYTNIATVKLFAHTEREGDYARSSMRIFLDTVYAQMRQINGFYASLYLINSLLPRFHDLEAGRTLIDDQDIAAVTQASLRANIGMVTQDAVLLHRSIADNIRYGRPDASDADLHAAIAGAHAGTHRELLARGGLYARLWAMQSGGFIGEDINARARAG